MKLGTLTPMQFLRKKENGKKMGGDTLHEEESIQDSFLGGLHRFSSEMPFAGALSSATLGALDDEESIQDFFLGGLHQFSSRFPSQVL